MDETSVKVAVRIRPLLRDELQQRCTECVKTVGIEPQITFGNDQNFTFDSVFGTNSTQSEIYEECVANLVEAIFEGFNATVLAYGQTSSGKTFTMGSASNVRLCEDQYGIIPRVSRHIFDNIKLQAEEDVNSTYRVHVQFLEIYGEEIRDLLDPSNCTSVTIRESPAGGVYVSGAREELTTSSDEMLAALERGSLVRTTGSTRMNESSSRSHAIFTILLERTIHHTSVTSGADENDSDSKASGDAAVDVDNILTETEPEVRKCKFHFVDLAGSERAKRTGAEGLRLREGIDINKGLLALGNVISALGDEQKRGKVHIPYRDSKLTRMLQDSLGGNSKTQMICCVSPADSNYNESLNAIRYANRARNIRNKPIVNLDPTAMIIQELRSQAKMMAVELLAYREGGVVSGDDTLPMTTLQDLAASKQPQLSAGSTKPNVPVGKFSGAPSGHSPSSAEASRRDISKAIARTNMDAIKFEQECVVLKSRLRDADDELRRTIEKHKRMLLQMSELSEQLVIVQSERDYYRIKCEENASALGGESERDSAVGVIAGYIREIEALRALNAKIHIDNNPERLAEHGTVSEGNDDWVVEESDMSGVANVIASTEEQLIEEKRLLQMMERGGGSDDEGDEDEGNVAVNRFESMAEKDRIFQRRQKVMTAEVHELNESIQLKELLVIQLQRSQRQYHEMKIFYEQKLEALCLEMEAKESEKRKVLEELQELSLRNEVASVKQGREDRLRQKLNNKEQELQTLRARQQELTHLSKVQTRSGEQLKKLETDIAAMKRQRIELTRQLQMEKKGHLRALNTKAKEIDHLKRELTRAMNKVKRLGDEKERAELKTREVIRENISRRKSGNLSGGLLSAPNARAISTRESRRVLSQNAPRPNGGRLLSAEEMKTKKWLDKQIRDIAARENAAEALRLQCEQQLALMHQKKQLEDFREPLRAVIMKAKRIDGDVSSQDDGILTVEEEEALADCEEKISKLEGQLKYRNAEISRMEHELRVGKGAHASHQRTVEMLKNSAASSLPAAHQLIHLLFDTLVSTRKSARMCKDRLEASQEREYRLNEDLDDALSRLNLEKRHHEKELSRMERDFEEKLAGLFNHSNLGAILSSSDSEGESLLPKKSIPAPWRSLSVPWHRSSATAAVGSMAAIVNGQKNGDDKYNALLALAHERTMSMKSQLLREEARVRELERSIDDHITEKKVLLSDIETKKMENNFLEDECRMLRDMVEDFRMRVKNLQGGVGENIIREVREADDYSSEGDSAGGDSTLDDSVLLELSSLGNEIQRTGTVSAPEDSSKSFEGGSSQDIFDRLTNPSNFTGTQKNIFEKDVESNRAKVQQIKEGALAHRRRKDDGKTIVPQTSDDGDELDTVGSSLLDCNLIENGTVCDDSATTLHCQPTDRRSRDSKGISTEKLVSDKGSAVTASPHGSRQLTPPNSSVRDQDNVFSRLLNPSKYTGIHRRKQHLPESPGSPNSHFAAANMDDRSNFGSSRSSRRLRSRSIDRGNDPVPQVRTADTDLDRRGSDRKVSKQSTDRDKDHSRRKSPGNV